MLITAKMDMMCFRNESSYVTHHIELSINATFILFVGFVGFLPQNVSEVGGKKNTL
jgi:ketopantoate hydroxymethyltransferase